MSIIERLNQEPPWHGAPLGAFNPKYQVTKRYLTDIERARSEGYSWGQIKRAVVAEAKAEGIWNGDNVSWELGEIYRQIKKG
jgi:hypothetical protein